jgi:hypothetical protein
MTGWGVGCMQWLGGGRIYSSLELDVEEPSPTFPPVFGSDVSLDQHRN